MVEAHARLLRSRGERALVTRNGQAASETRALLHPSESCLSFGPGLDIQPGDEVALTPRNKCYVISRTERDVQHDRVIAIRAYFVSEQRSPSRGDTVHGHNFAGATISNATFLLDSPGATQTVGLPASLKEAVQIILEALDELHLDASDKDQIRADVACLQTQIASPKPQPSVVRELLAGVRAKVFAGLGSDAANSIVNRVERAFAFLTQIVSG